jgi:hypothetical protein
MALVGNTNEEMIWNFLIGKGLTPAQAAGIMANMQHESGFNPEATNPSSGAYGLVQWLGGRKSNLQNIANKDGRYVGDLEYQLDYLWEELNGPERRAYDALLQTNDPASSARVFHDEFERGGVNTGPRERTAGEIFDAFKDLVPTPPPSAEAVAAYQNWLAQGYQGDHNAFIEWTKNPYPAPGVGEAFEKWKTENNKPNATPEEWKAAVEAEKEAIANLPPKDVLDAFAAWRSIPGNENKTSDDWVADIEAKKKSNGAPAPTEPPKIEQPPTGTEPEGNKENTPTTNPGPQTPGTEIKPSNPPQPSEQVPTNPSPLPSSAASWQPVEVHRDASGNITGLSRPLSQEEMDYIRAQSAASTEPSLPPAGVTAEAIKGYQDWLAAGNTGSAADWAASVSGDNPIM